MCKSFGLELPGVWELFIVVVVVVVCSLVEFTCVLYTLVVDAALLCKVFCLAIIGEEMNIYL